MSAPIPLLQYWHDGNPPPGVRRRMAGWAADPDFEVVVFDDPQAEQFVADHYGGEVLASFRSCGIPAMRADFFRYTWLHVNGGAYVDADVKNLGGAGDVFRATGRGCLFLRAENLPPKREGWRPGRITNNFMFVRNPGDAVMAHAVEQATRNVAERISNDVWEVTGPGIFTEIWGEGGVRCQEFFEGYTIHLFDEVAKRVAQFGHMPFKNRDTYWRKFRDDPSHGSIFADPAPVDPAPAAPQPAAGTSSGDELRLPPGTRLLHIGPPKTGSTAIQGALKSARPRLAEHGVSYVGVDRARRAAWAIGVRGAPGDRKRQPEELWTKLVADVADAGDHRVCISNEDFGRAEPDQLRRIAGELGGDRSHVVSVVRSLDRLLPSLWQQRVKAGSPLGWEEWLRIVLDRPGAPSAWDDAGPAEHTEHTNVWYPHDTAALVRRWADVVGLDRVTLIVPDSRDRQLLPRTFERMLGLPEDLLSLQPSHSNESLPWCDVEFVRAVNEALIAREVPRRARRRLVSRGLVLDLMSRPVEEGTTRTPPFPEWAAPVVRELSDARVEAVRSVGARVVGDAESLRVHDVVTGDASRPPAIPGVAAARAVDWVIGELLPGRRA